MVYGVLLVILSCPVKKKKLKSLRNSSGEVKTREKIQGTSGVEGEACLWGFTLQQWGPDPVPPSAIEICRHQCLTSPQASFPPPPKSSFSAHSVKWSIRALEATAVELGWQFFCRTDHMEKPDLFKQISHVVGAQPYVCPVRNCKDLFRTGTLKTFACSSVLDCSADRKTVWHRWTCVAPLLHRYSLTSDKRTDHSLAHGDT